MRRRFYPADDGRKYTRLFLSNISMWGPKAERFLDEYRGDKFHVVGFVESHLLPSNFLALQGRFSSWGRRPFAAHAAGSGRSLEGSSGGALICPSLSLQIGMGAGDDSDWKIKGKDWHLLEIRAKHCSYLIIVAYMDHSIGARGNNIAKMQQIQRAVMYWKLPYTIFADWNMTPQALEESGFVGPLDGEIKVAPDISETCISGNILDFLVVARSFSSAISLFQASSRSPWRAHRGFEIDIIRSPRSVHILSVIKPAALDLDNLQDKEDRPCWSKASGCTDNIEQEDDKIYAKLLLPIFKNAIVDCSEVGKGYRNFSAKAEDHIVKPINTPRGMAGRTATGDGFLNSS